MYFTDNPVKKIKQQNRVTIAMYIGEMKKVFEHFFVKFLCTFCALTIYAQPFSQ